MRALLIDDQTGSRQELAGILVQEGFETAVSSDSLDGGIKILELRPAGLDLAVCNYRGNSRVLLQRYVDLTANIPAVLFSEAEIDSLQLSMLKRKAPLESVDRRKVGGFAFSLNRIRAYVEDQATLDSDFFRIPTSALVITTPIAADVFIRLGPDHYIKRFRREDGFDASDLQACLRKESLPFLFFRKTQAEFLLGSRVVALDRLIEQEKATIESLRKGGRESLEVVHNVVSQIGFTPKTEELVKKTVSLVLRAVGASPSLSEILRQMKAHKGKYISSHSLMLAEVACAVLHQSGLSSGPTFTKLAIAALLHDLSLKDNRLAQMRILEGVGEKNGFSSDDRQKFKLHPIHAADLSQRLKEMPSDVETILAQHHESPDGSGFPRGLFHHQIGLLSSVFIVAHDLLDFYLDRKAGRAEKFSMQAFLADRDFLYKEGNFRKIRDSLLGGTALAE